MKANGTHFHLAAAAGLALVATTAARAQLPNDAAAGQPPGAEVLTTGPMHEAFAAPLVYDPRPGPVVPKAPPAPIQETPPDQMPQGANVQWIPGYWGWDDSRGDYIWVSGVWRDVPPGRQWTPGYWTQVENGYQWVPGAWTALDQTQAQYLPAPPASLEAGPTSDPPGENMTWTPGTWVWQNNAYSWQPGFWSPVQSNWMWNPGHYNWTPNGYMFVNGYWDYPLAQRGQLFAPVYFPQSVYSQPNFAYTPSIGLLSGGLLSSLFVRPSYGQYYYGNYYGANNFQSGYYPWYAFHQSRYGYDPLYSYYNAVNTRTDPGWRNRIYQDYQDRSRNAAARPPLTYADQVRRGSSAAYARPLNQLAAAPNQAVRFEQIDAARRQEMAQRAAQVHQFRDQRVQREVQAARAQPANAERARTVDVPRSPIAGHPPEHFQAANRAQYAPPAVPQHPQPNPAIRPATQQDVARFRPEPHPQMRPPEHAHEQPGRRSR